MAQRSRLRGTGRVSPLPAVGLVPAVGVGVGVGVVGFSSAVREVGSHGGDVEE